MSDCRNINASEANRKKRATAYWPLIVTVVDDLDAGKPEATRLNIKKFMMHVAWHEGARLTARKQIPNGPGRSFLQMEPPRTSDGYDFAVTKGWVDRLTSSSGATEAELATARTAIQGKADWPAGNRFEQELAACDLFGLYLARIALKRLSAPIGTTNQAHAEYWADNWKISFSSPAERLQQIGVVKDEADEVDALLTEAGLISSLLFVPERAAPSYADSWESDAAFVATAAQDIIDACEDVWEANKSDCNAFVRAVAGEIGATIASGNADAIITGLVDAGVRTTKSGATAKDWADGGAFVVAGLKAGDHTPPRTNGHVAIVVRGPLDTTHGKYPTGYWGSLGGVGKKNTTLNFSWNAADRDNVTYFEAMAAPA